MNRCVLCQRDTFFGDDLCGRCFDRKMRELDRDFRRRALKLAVLVGFIIAVFVAIVYFLVERYG